MYTHTHAHTNTSATFLGPPHGPQVLGLMDKRVKKKIRLLSRLSSTPTPIHRDDGTVWRPLSSSTASSSPEQESITAAPSICILRRLCLTFLPTNYQAASGTRLTFSRACTCPPSRARPRQRPPFRPETPAAPRCSRGTRRR